MSATTIRVGLLYIDNAGAGVSSLGVQGYTQGDEVGEFRALVADLNRRGGAAGRTVQVVPHDCGQSCTTGDPAAFEAACTYFSQDEPVFMVFSSIGFTSQVSECLAKKDIGFIVSAGVAAERLMRNRPVYLPDDISLERYARVLVTSLVAGRFFGADAKVGIVRADDPDYARVTKDILRPALKAAAVQVVDEQTGGDPASVVFRLRSNGVTHVLTYSTPLFLMTAAEGQQWRPFWSVASNIGPGAFLEGAAPREQLLRSMGPGWQPGADVNAGQNVSVGAGQTRCLETLRRAGYTPTGTPRAVALIMCGELYHFESTLLRSREVSAAGYRVSAESLAPYPSPLTFALDFAGGKHAGASRYRLNAYQAACSCYRYVSGLRPIPAA